MASKKFDFNKSVIDLTDADLKARIQEDELRLKKLEFAHAISPLENPMRIRENKKLVARILTSITAKKLVK